MKMAKANLFYDKEETERLAGLVFKSYKSLLKARDADPLDQAALLLSFVALPAAMVSRAELLEDHQRRELAELVNRFGKIMAAGGNLIAGEVLYRAGSISSRASSLLPDTVASSMVDVVARAQNRGTL